VNTRAKKNIAASARARLLNLAKARGEDFNLVLTRYGLERLLYRLSKSSYQDRFILKGAMLFAVWTDDPHRATRDVDFLGFGDSAVNQIAQIFKELCAVQVEEDGVIFLPETVTAEPIRDHMEYGGVRVVMRGELAGARIPIQADIGFGDAITPEASEISYPVLLADPAPILLSYPRETVVAEKYQALVSLGVANTRMKDFYDLWVLAREYEFEGAILLQAIKATFSRRQTAVPEQTPLALTADFFEDPQKNTQWDAFLNKGVNYDTTGLADVCGLLESFLLPPTQAIGRNEEFTAHWPTGGPWTG